MKKNHQTQHSQRNYPMLPDVLVTSPVQQTTRTTKTVVMVVVVVKVVVVAVVVAGEGMFNHHQQQRKEKDLVKEMPISVQLVQTKAIAGIRKNKKNQINEKKNEKEMKNRKMMTTIPNNSQVNVQRLATVVQAIKEVLKQQQEEEKSVHQQPKPKHLLLLQYNSRTHLVNS